MTFKIERRDQILNVAVQLLAEKGYRDTSMLQIAKRASASKETLYSWFGDKKGLFTELIKRNAAKAQTPLPLQPDADINATLTEFGIKLLSMLLSESAIAINRAAISEAQADPSLSRALIEHGRAATLPVLLEFLKTCNSNGHLRIDDP